MKKIKSPFRLHQGRLRLTTLRLYSLVVGLLIVCSVSCVTAQERYSYTVKGVVRALPGNGLAANEILVKHEPIPEYRDETGTVVGMMAMTMPFYLSESISAKDLQAGDSIEMVVEQRLKPTFEERVISLKRVK